MALGEAADRAAALAPIHPVLIQRFCFLNASRPCLLSRTLSPHPNVVFGASPKELFHHEPPSACSHQPAVVRSEPAAARVPPRPPPARSQCQPRVSPDSLALMAEHRDDLHVRHRRYPCQRGERFEEALQRLLHWSEVYSRDVFPEPDWEKAGELLKAGGKSIDVIRLNCMRRVMERVGQIAREALAEPPAASDR
jgi:hypothetical protein